MLRGVNSARGKGVDTLLLRGKAGVLLVRIELKVGDSDAGVSRGEGNDRSAPRGGEHRCAANALL